MRIQTGISKNCRAVLFALGLGFGLGSFTLSNGQNFPLPPPTPFPGVEDPIPAPVPTSPVTVGLQSVATGLVSPVTGTFAPGHPNDIFVLDQPGPIWDIHIPGNSEGDDDKGGSTANPAAPTKSLFLDLTGRLVAVGHLFPGFPYDERGMLGLAFHPRFLQNGLFYTFTSEPVKGSADFSTMNINNPTHAAANCQTVITEWKVQNPAQEPLAVDLASAREVMRIDKPYFNHNGGTLAFDEDGLLYISVGDGGNGNDTGIGHVPGGNGQSLAGGNVLGKILRINPLERNSANGKYGIPEDNPFVHSATIPHEIYSYGHRNPYRMSFDREGESLTVFDVGQNSLEEIDHEVRGGNYGWPIKEGTFLFAVNPTDTNILSSGYVYANSAGYPPNLIDPIGEYDHTDDGGKSEVRAAIIGGFLYEGEELKGLKRHLIFGDYASGVGAKVASGHIMALFGDTPEYLTVAGRPGALGLFVLGFARDTHGEIYVLGNTTGLVTGITGQVLKLTQP
jgi:glucose/arabinose dehydrogenase